VAGVINPPSAQKYGYWTRADCPANPQDWFNGAEQNQGSWWTDWQEWIKLHAGDKIPARTIKKSLEPAPGSYVRRKAE
jgi:polyhydroxyalkanoate synthase